MNYCFVTKFFLFIFLSINLFIGKHTYADNTHHEFYNNIAIFYPKAREPYNAIYQKITAGCIEAAEENNQKIIIKTNIITKHFNTEEIAQNLEQQHINKVIVLGRSGWKLAKQLSQYTLRNKSAKFQVVSGALPITPNGVSGISLITDPAYLFNYLKQVAPNITKVHVAYSKKSAWLIKLAKIAAQEKGLILNLQPVSSTAEAITFYQDLFASGVSNKDAIWLPFDRISSHDKITLPLILEKAWAEEVVIFSSKPSHAKRGVLFSTYPDNFALGKHLFTMVQELEQQPKQKNFAALKSTLLAVNLRTAAHLGLKYSTEQQQLFKLIFP
ncbi:MAG: ABC transporter substrate binding protein [Colwellia sp.]